MCSTRVYLKQSKKAYIVHKTGNEISSRVCDVLDLEGEQHFGQSMLARQNLAPASQGNLRSTPFTPANEICQISQAQGAGELSMEESF